MGKEKQKNLQKIADSLPNPKLLSMLAISLILGVIIYLVILLINIR